MIVTKLEEINKSRINVYIDDEFAFWLNRKELTEHQITERCSISEAVYHTIYNDLIFERAKDKALYIIEFSDRTELELRRKLKEADYPEEIVDRVITYVTSYGYLNEERLAGAYIRSRMNRKSKLVIRMELLQKGVSKDTIDLALAKEYEDHTEEDPELEAIRKAVSKRTKEPQTLDYEAKQKLIASLYRKGFDPGKIRQVIEE